MAKKSRDEVRFIRAELHRRLMQSGHTDENAATVLSMVTDKEIEDQLDKCCAKAKVKMKAFGDGSLLKRLRELAPAILETAKTIFEALSLLGILKKDGGDDDEDEENE